MKRGLTVKSFKPEDLARELDAYGADGWELVSTVPISGNAGIASWGAGTVNVIFIFKKEII